MKAMSVKVIKLKYLKSSKEFIMGGGEMSKESCRRPGQSNSRARSCRGPYQLVVLSLAVHGNYLKNFKSTNGWVLFLVIDIIDLDGV